MTERKLAEAMVARMSLDTIEERLVDFLAEHYRQYLVDFHNDLIVIERME